MSTYATSLRVELSAGSDEEAQILAESIAGTLRRRLEVTHVEGPDTECIYDCSEDDDDIPF